MRATKFLLLILGFILMTPTIAQGTGLYALDVGPGNLRVMYGGAAKFSVTGSTGLLTASNTASSGTGNTFTTNSLSSGVGTLHTSSAAFSGSLFKLAGGGAATGSFCNIYSITATSAKFYAATADTDAFTGYFAYFLGGTDHATEAFSVDYAGTIRTNGGTTALTVPASSGAAGKAIGIVTGAGNGGTTTGLAGGAYSVTTGAGTAGTTTGGAGGASTHILGNGGTSVTGTTGAGGAYSLTAGNAGAASGAGTSGTAGAIDLVAGNAGTIVGAGTVALGGRITLTCGTGSGGTPTVGGPGGSLTVTAGPGGAGTTGGAGGDIKLYTGLPGAGGSPANGAFTVKVGGASGTSVMTASSTGQTSLCRGVLTQPIIGGAVTDYDAQAATVTIAGLLGGVVTQNSKTGASTATTPTGTEISAGITGYQVGDTFRVLYYNRGNQTSTITAGASGVTVYGTAAIATTKTALLLFICTGTNAWSCYVVAGA